jgi:branched-chain amino acid transport system permease protein
VTFLVIGGLGTVAGPVVGTFGPTFGLAIDWVKRHLGAISSLLFGIGALLTVATQPEGAMGAWRKNFADIKRKQAAKGKPFPVRPPVEVTPEMMAPRPRGTDLGDTPVLQVTKLQKRFGGLAALADLDLTVARGTVHALIGPNGSGKSTFVNVVTGFYPATEGEIVVQGKSVGHMRTHERSRLGVARTFQNLQVWRRMSVLENVMVGLHDRVRIGLVPSMLGIGRRKEKLASDRAWGLLHFVGLADKARQPAGNLAFADQRRLEIARALAADPDLLLLDEPAAGMHPSEIKDLIVLINRIREAGVTVLLIEHHMDLVMGISDRITVLDYGRKIAEGTPDEVRGDQRVIEAYLGAEA